MLIDLRSNKYLIHFKDDKPGDSSAAVGDIKHGPSAGYVEQAATHEEGQAREGTSATRYDQQAHTHAEGQLANTTPQVKVDGQGESQGIMDPKTVGQAPKEHPMPKEEAPAPGYMEQAQSMANEAMEQAKHLPEHVKHALGYGPSEEEKQKEEEERKRREEEEKPKEDPEVDGMEGGKVEEFLRSQTMSKPKMGK